jgi:hypothetical protein
MILKQISKGDNHNKTKTEDANKEFDTLRHEIIADAKDKKNKSETQAQVLIFINTWWA